MFYQTWYHLTSPHLSRPSTLISLCSSQEQRGEGKIQWRNSSEVYADTGNEYTWFTWEVIWEQWGLGNWESDTGKRRSQQRVLMNRAGSGHLGLSPAGGPLRDCRTLFKLSQRRMRKWGYLSTNSHLSLFEGCSQPEHQLSSTVPCKAWACSCGQRKPPGGNPQLPHVQGQGHASELYWGNLQSS